MKAEPEGRTRDFPIPSVILIRTLSRTVDEIEVGRQLLQSAESMGCRLLLVCDPYILIPP